MKMLDKKFGELGIANQFVAPESVKKARYRMRKKLELEPEANVSEYLMNF